MSKQTVKKAKDEELVKAQQLLAQKAQEQVQACAKELEAVLQKYGMAIMPGQPQLVPRR